MAIVKTTTRETGSGPNGGNGSTEIEKPVDRTKSVVNQGGRPATRPTRTPGVAARPQAQSAQVANPRVFVNDTLAELRKVVWPTKEERSAGTIVTIGLLVFFALYILGLDNLIRSIFEWLKILPPGTPS